MATNDSGRGPVQCPWCGGTEYQEGFIDDVAQGRVRWLAGTFVRGLFGNAKSRSSLPQTVVTAYRCTTCNRLELVAGERT
ncbi:MAG: hypothetical protein ACI379_01615 [Nocardioides sp.]|uniref:hypothetical protein n=1 Tax=Nocardioides sp. TaxID=35761 RepID=UPI003F097E23